MKRSQIQRCHCEGREAARSNPLIEIAQPVASHTKCDEAISSVAPRNDTVGFTLIELMIAVTILAFGLVGVIRAYVVMIDVLENADYRLEAVSVLENKMAELEMKAIEAGNVPAGTTGGKLKMWGTNYAWNMDVQVVDSMLPSQEEEDSPIESPDVYLNNAKVTIVNQSANPPKKFSLAGYVEGYVEE